MSSATGRWRESPPTAVKNEEDNGRCPRELRVQSEAVLAGRYRLEERLGRGGMGEVWRAFDPHLEREVAVKLILSGDNDGVLIRRFQREARISANIQHPNITAVHDFGHHEGQLFLVMELLRGRDLGAVLADHPQGMPLDLVVSVAVQAADALRAAHTHRVVHRDLKPGNLFLLDTGHVKVCDFGIAHIADATSQLTAVGTALGTPAFMPPEQWKGEEVDSRSDVYALGGVMHTMLTGRIPFTGPLPALLAQHLTQDPPPIREFRPDVPLELADLVARMMAKDPAARPDSHELGSSSTGLPHPRRPVPQRSLARRSPRRRSPRHRPRQHLYRRSPLMRPGMPHPASGCLRPRSLIPLPTRPRRATRRRCSLSGCATVNKATSPEPSPGTGRPRKPDISTPRCNLALLSRERGNLVEAESWYRRAAEVGDVDAMVNLGDLLKERGESAEAELWHRRAAEAGHIASMHTLGNLLYSKGDTAEAETWWSPGRRKPETSAPWECWQSAGAAR